MPNETILKARLIKGGLIECRFTRRGHGARNWMYIVDEWGDRFKKLARKSEGDFHTDTSKTLGQGAVMVLPRSAYAKLRLGFENEVGVRKAIERGEFRFDETVGVIEVLMTRVLRLQRKALANSANERAARARSPEPV